MAGHGGARPGAGRPPTTLAQARYWLLSGIHLGLADAARARGAKGTDDECSVAAIRMISQDMILAGRGEDLLRIYATVSASRAGGETKEDERRSPILRALEALPPVPITSRPLPRPPGAGAAVDEEATGAPDSDSDVPPGEEDPWPRSSHPAPPPGPAGGGELLAGGPGPAFHPTFVPQLALIDGWGRTASEAQAGAPGPGGAPPPPPRPGSRGSFALHTAPHDFSRVVGG